jgi:hypothetical protein
VRFDPGQILTAEWDGDGSWRVLRVEAVEDERLDVSLYPERFPGPPARAVLDGLVDDVWEPQQIDADALALMWPSELEPAPEERRSTRRGLLEGLLRGGIERGEDLARRRRWR